MRRASKSKQSLVDATHGRWPWVAAASIPPSVAIMLWQREWLAKDGNWALWLPLPVYFMHQTEEWVKPGGFLPWCNQVLIGSEEDEFPLTRRVGFWINVGFGWGLALVGALLGKRRPAVATTVLASLGGNAAMHIHEAVTAKKYNPGTGTSITLLGPLAVAGITSLARDPKVSKHNIGAGIVGGALSAVLMFGSMRIRLKRSKK